MTSDPERLSEPGIDDARVTRSTIGSDAHESATAPVKHGPKKPGSETPRNRPGLETGEVLPLSMLLPPPEATTNFLRNFYSAV
jgi:hypothetical protein